MSKWSFQQVRRWDTALGLPFCLLLVPWVMAARGLRRARLIRDPRTIVVLKWFGLGSLVLMQPLLEAVRKRYPRAKIVVLTFAGNEGLLKLFGFCDEVRTVRLDSWRLFGWDVLRRLLEWGWRGADIALDLEFYSKFSTLMAYLTGARMRVGFDLPFLWRKTFLTHGVTLDHDKHITEMYRMVGRVIDAPSARLLPSPLTCAPDVIRQVRLVLENRGWTQDRKIIGFNVNASDMMYSRRWRPEHFVAVIEEIASDADVPCGVVLTGARSERAYVDRLYARLSPRARHHTVNAAGIFDLPHFIALCGAMDLFVTNDTGPLHLAVLQGTPTVSLWGPGTPFLYGPPRSNDHKVFYRGLDCSPCHYVYFTEPEEACGGRITCLEEIRPAWVAAYIREFVNKGVACGRPDGAAR